MAEKLSKKEKKALAFKKSKNEPKPVKDESKIDSNDSKSDSKSDSKTVSKTDSKTDAKTDSKVKSTTEPKTDSKVQNQAETKTKRKREDADARPAKKARAAPRFILFIGNLPYDCTEATLRQHFETANPTTIRMRKGFAFMEFAGDEASKNLHVALRFHHSTLKYRKINVELTAGGGGNSKNRRQKVAEKNAALQDELSEQIEKEKKQRQEAKDPKNFRGKDKAKADKADKADKPVDVANVHPDRLKNLR